MLAGDKGPQQHRVPHELRDTANEHVLSVMSDLRYETTMTAAQSHCHSCTVPVSKVVTQRSH